MRARANNGTRRPRRRRRDHALAPRRWGRPGDSKEALQELRLWPENRKALPKPGEQATEIQREFAKWHTWTSIIGFPVMGIFPRGVAPEKMNTIAVSNGTAGKEEPHARGKLLVAATDMGEVRARAAGRRARSWRGYARRRPSPWVRERESPRRARAVSALAPAGMTALARSVGRWAARL